MLLLLDMDMYTSVEYSMCECRSFNMHHHYEGTNPSWVIYTIL